MWLQVFKSFHISCFNDISTIFQRYFNDISTIFQRYFNDVFSLNATPPFARYGDCDGDDVKKMTKKTTTMT